MAPKFFTEDHQVEKISGIYVPFWLYDCDSRFHGNYKATRIHHWSDSQYNYTRTDYYHLIRGATAAFDRIPMDASKKMDDSIMESIEPFDYSQIVDFETAYLSGYLADKYDVDSAAASPRATERIKESTEVSFRNTADGTDVTVTVPANTSATVYLPNGAVHHVSAGRHVFHAPIKP